MTGRFLSGPIMKPNRCWTILHVSIWAGLLLTLNADSEDTKCFVETKVPRNKSYEAFLGEDLKIDCKVEFCDQPPPTVSWFKFEHNFNPVNFSSSSHIKTEWELSKQLEGKSFLIFQKIRINDSGEYQCQSNGSTSHSINVSVKGDGGRTNVTPKNDTEIDTWNFMYFAAGIVAFVIIVIIISVISMRGCKGKSKKETKTENQYMAIPMVEQPLTHAGLQPSPRGSPSVPPSQRSLKTKRPRSQPNELPLPGDNEPVYSKTKKERERRGNTVEEEGGSIVYAALNHPARAAQPPRPKEECSEYAAIRV